jgi:hypothetical protein
MSKRSRCGEENMKSSSSKTEEDEKQEQDGGSQIPEKVETRRGQSYVIFSVYYKYGEYCVTEVKSRQELREFLLEELSQYLKGEDPVGETIEEQLMSLTDEELIALAVRKGRDFLRREKGSGIVAVIEGNCLAH